MKDFFDKIGKFGGSCRDIFLELFWYRKFSAFFIYGGILLNGISWAVLWQLTKLKQETVILHYNSYLGIDVMLNTAENYYLDLFLVVIGGGVVLLLNIFLAGLLMYLAGVLEKKHIQNNKREEGKELDVNLLGSNLVITGGFLVQLVILVYSIAILFVN